MKVTRILHVSLNTAGSLESTRTFYATLFGLPEEARPRIEGIPGRWFGIGDAQLHLVGASARGAGIDPTGPHFCVGVDDIEGAVAELEAAGIPYERALQGEGVVQVWVRDPSGATVELQQDPAAGSVKLNG